MLIWKQIDSSGYSALSGRQGAKLKRLSIEAESGCSPTTAATVPASTSAPNVPPRLIRAPRPPSPLQDTKKRVHDRDLEKRRGEERYAQLVASDKKRCTECGAVQSYDEVLEKRDSCPNCPDGVYRTLHNWQEVERRFFCADEAEQRQGAEQGGDDDAAGA